ncbi:MAG: DUF2007 domain-containing protein [Anaerolineales bacterium]|nr:DUF2007 domain-containing protein [Anaerolineales bacterium]MCB0016320.1 DUF2007 domain-containing protein [Anaerolineales bacterium]
MSELTLNSVPLPEDPAGKKSRPIRRAARQAGSQEVKWVVVAEEAGLVPAEIVAQHLQVEGIPARARQEPAGQALGLTVAILGTGFVLVPESFEARARAILESEIQE